MGRTSRPLTQNDIFLGHLKVVTLEATNGRFFFFSSNFTRNSTKPDTDVCPVRGSDKIDGSTLALSHTARPSQSIIRPIYVKCVYKIMVKKRDKKRIQRGVRV